MKFVKIFCVNIFLLMILSVTGIGQNISQITFINELDVKSAAAYGDALSMFRFQEGTASVSNSYMLSGYSDESKLTKGMASLMMARYLNLKKSLMYNIFGTERYAYRACLADNLFSGYGSENDLMSGAELIELFSKVKEFKNGR